jgi:hypothetical protein
MCCSIFFYITTCDESPCHAEFKSKGIFKYWYVAKYASFRYRTV